MSTGYRISDEMRARLLGEEVQLRKQVEEGSPAAGDAISVSWDPQFAAKEKIGRYGRMTLDEAGFVYHVAPKEIDRRVRYDLDPTNSMISVNRWLSGERLDVPIGKLSGVMETVKMTTDWDAGCYEHSLLYILSRTYPVVLFNPSWKSLSAAARVDVGPFGSIKVYLNIRDTWEEDWAREVRNFCRNSSGRVTVEDRMKISDDAIYFTGESNPKTRIWGKWIRFIPSPYAASHRPEFQETEFGLDMVREVRKDGVVRQICSTLPLKSEFVYNPETVDKWLGQAGVKYFVESSFAMNLTPVSSSHLFQTPKYIEYPKKIVVQKDELGRLLTLDASEPEKGIVYDVFSSNTYHSKRSIHADLNWVEFSDTGTHYVTYSSISPTKTVCDIVKGIMHLSVGALGVEAVYDKGELDAPKGKKWKMKDGVEDYALEDSLMGFSHVKKLENLEGRVTLHADCQQDREFPGFYQTEAGKLIPAVTYQAKRGTLVVIPPDVPVTAVYPSLAAVFMYSPRSSPWKSLTKLRGPLARIDGGTIAHSDAEQSFYQKFRKGVSSLKDSGITVAHITKGTTMPSQVALNKLCNAPGVILWSLKPVSFQLLHEIEIPLDGWVNGDQEFRITSFRDMWRAIENRAFSLSFPIGFDASPIMRILSWNGFFPKRMLDYCAYTWQLNWVKVSRDVSTREVMESVVDLI